MQSPKRSCLRIKTNLRAALFDSTGAEKTLAFVTNMSVVGIQILTSRDFAKGEACVLDMRLPGSELFFQLTCRVTRSNRNHNKKSNLGYFIALEIIEAPENWEKTAGEWIVSQSERKNKRKIAAVFLSITGIALALKGAITLWAQLTEAIYRHETTSNSGDALTVLESFFAAEPVGLAIWLGLCSWTCLKPKAQLNPFFSSQGSLIIMAYLSLRLGLKLVTLKDPLEELSGLVIDATILSIGLIGALYSRRLEKSYRHFRMMAQYESIFPRAKKPKT